eukprot:10325548-Prorocentrum_lima.AAC.1
MPVGASTLATGGNVSPWGRPRGLPQGAALGNFEVCRPPVPAAVLCCWLYRWRSHPRKALTPD